MTVAPEEFDIRHIIAHKGVNWADLDVAKSTAHSISVRVKVIDILRVEY